MGATGSAMSSTSSAAVRQTAAVEFRSFRSLCITSIACKLRHNSRHINVARRRLALRRRPCGNRRGYHQENPAPPDQVDQRVQVDFEGSSLTCPIGEQYVEIAFE